MGKIVEIGEALAEICVARFLFFLLEGEEFGVACECFNEVVLLLCLLQLILLIGILFASLLEILLQL